MISAMIAAQRGPLLAPRAVLSKQLLSVSRKRGVLLIVIVVAALLVLFSQTGLHMADDDLASGVLQEQPLAPKSLLEQRVEAEEALFQARKLAEAEASSIVVKDEDPGGHSGDHFALTPAQQGGAADSGSMGRGSGGSKRARKKHVFSDRVRRLVSEVLEEGDDTADTVCRSEEHANYQGEEVVKWGGSNLQLSAATCCASCMAEPKCNVWVWCAVRGGCDGGRAYRECWLKHASLKAVRDSVGKTHPDIPWTSGTTLGQDELRGDHTQLHWQALREDPAIPLVYLDVSIRGHSAGRIVVALFYTSSPLAAENFRQLCTGEKSMVPWGHMGAGVAYSLKGASFVKIVERSSIQFGIDTDSVYGGAFPNDPEGLQTRHDRPGLLSMVAGVDGQKGNMAHFAIAMAPAPHLNGRQVVFGEVVEGMGVARKVNLLAMGKKDGVAGTEEQAVIADCGLIRPPTPLAQRLALTAASRMAKQASSATSTNTAGGAGSNSTSSSRERAGAGKATGSSTSSGSGDERDNAAAATLRSSTSTASVTRTLRRIR